MEQMVRRNQYLKQKVFNTFHKIKQKKEIRSEFFARMLYFYQDYVLKKYFDILKNQKELKWDYEALKQRVAIFWKENVLKKYFKHLRQGKIVRLQQDRAVQKKINICKMIFKKTHARMLIHKLKENLERKRVIQNKYKQMDLFKQKQYFRILNNNKERKHIKQKRIKLADNYFQNRLAILKKSMYFKMLQSYTKQSKQHKKKSQQLKMKILKKYFNRFIGQLEYNFNVNIYYADKHYEKKQIKLFFNALKQYQNAAHYNKIKSNKKSKLNLKDSFNCLKNYWKKAKLETKKRYIIHRQRQKVIKQIAYRIWREQYIQKLSQKQKEVNTQKISKNTYLKKSFQILKTYKSEQQQKHIKYKRVDKNILKKYFKYLVQFYKKKAKLQEKERQARKFNFIKSLQSSFKQMKQLYLQKRSIITKIVQKENEKNRQICQNIFKILQNRRQRKREKRQRYQNFSQRRQNKRIQEQFNAIKKYSKDKRQKQNQLKRYKKSIQNGYLRRVITQWKNKAYLKKNTREYFNEKQILIEKKIGFKKLKQNINELKTYKQKLRAAKLKKMIKIKKLIFNHLKQFLWLKQYNKQNLKDKQNIYLAKLLIKSLYAWRIYLKAVIILTYFFNYSLFLITLFLTTFLFSFHLRSKIKLQTLFIWKGVLQIKIMIFNKKEIQKQYKIQYFLKLSKLFLILIQLKRAKQKVKYVILHWSKQKKKLSFKKMKEFLVLKKQKQQEELHAFNLYVSHQQHEVLKKAIMMGIKIKEQRIIKQKNEVLKLKLREQDLALKYGKKWLNFYEKRRHLKLQINRTTVGNKQRVNSRQQSYDQNENIRQQKKDTLYFDKSNRKQHTHQMSFFPNQQQNQFHQQYFQTKESFQDKMNPSPDRQQQFQQNTPHIFKSNSTFRQNSDDKAQEILNWFDKDFMQKNKMVPKRIGSQDPQNQQKTIQLQQKQLNQQRDENYYQKQDQQNVVTNKQLQFAPIQRQHANQNYFNPSDIDIMQNTNNFVYGSSNLNRNNNQKVSTSQSNINQTSHLHLSNIAQLLDQDHSVTIIEDIREKNKQLELMLAEYQQNKQQGDQIKAGQLKPLIQDKLLEIKQLKNNL